MTKYERTLRKAGWTPENFPSMKASWLLGMVAGAMWAQEGLPFECFLDTARDAGVEVDRAGFEHYMEHHRRRSKGVVVATPTYAEYAAGGMPLIGEAT